MEEHYIKINYQYTHEITKLECLEFPNVDEIKGEIFSCDFEENETKAGEIELHYYNDGFIDHGFELFDAFDRSADAAMLGEILLDLESGVIKKEIEEKIGMSFDNNILVIHDLMLLPEFRGKGYGKEIISGIETYFNGRCGYIAFQSFPKQHIRKIETQEMYKTYRLDLLNKDYEDSQSRLSKFYKKCGYTQIDFEDHVFIKNMFPM